jgi:glycyl-tRNA synthetase beta chain
MNITEYPYPLRGEFDAKFLAIPKEVLVNVMKSHQRYIPILNGQGELMPYFIFFANTVPVEDKNVIRGNEKVLRARLADAEFFFEEDKKNLLSSLYDRLSSIVFHVKIGTLKQKTDRVMKIAHSLSAILGFADMKKVERAVMMMKADLLTHMVGEFPELQGVMGRIYAGHQGEADDVARAIEEHYLPSGGNGSLPETPLGAIISIADKIDSLTAFFSVGITPTGNLDPYALRRQSLGIIKIAIDKKLHIPLEGLIETAYASGDNINKRLSLEETKISLVDFIVTRFKFSMIEEGRNQQFVESVLPFVAKDIYDGYVRLTTLETQKSIEDFKKLMIGFKRAFNITKLITEDREINASLLTEMQERMLFELYESNKEKFFNLISERKYDSALSILVGFKETIDSYFDKVFVMDKDEAIKDNRLALLKKIKDMFLMFGDFSKIHFE